MFSALVVKPLEIVTRILTMTRERKLKLKINNSLKSIREFRMQEKSQPQNLERWVHPESHGNYICRS